MSKQKTRVDKLDRAELEAIAEYSDSLAYKIMKSFQEEESDKNEG